MLIVVFDVFYWLTKKFESYIMFSVVGVVGAGVNFSLLYLLTDRVKLWYLASATIATMVAATTNYFLNNYWTFRNRRDSNPRLSVGWLKYLVTMLFTETFYLVLVYLFTDKVGLFYMLSAFLSLSITTVFRYVTAVNWIWKGSQLANKTLLEQLEEGIG